jgi:hypothetical protein
MFERRSSIGNVLGNNESNPSAKVGARSPRRTRARDNLKHIPSQCLSEVTLKQEQTRLYTCIHLQGAYRRLRLRLSH